MRNEFPYRDIIGRKLNYGDTIEDLNSRRIGVIVWNKEYHAPMLHLISQFSRKFQQYIPISNCSTTESIEKFFVPQHRKIWWWLHGMRLDNVELIYRNGG